MKIFEVDQIDLGPELIPDECGAVGVFRLSPI